MTNFWKIVNDVIDNADVLLLVLDARLVLETRNLEVERKVGISRKPLIYVVTKCDLVEKKEAEAWKKTLNPCVFISSTKHFGTTRLRERILIEAQKAKIDGIIQVGVLGYPNVGKSSLINALKGKKAAPTSIMSGYTKGVQKIKADNRIMLYDTPGVIPYKEESNMKHAMIGTIDFTKVREPDMVVMELLEKFPGIIEKYYGVKTNDDPEELIEEIAVKNNILVKGGDPDMLRMSRMILKDWQKGAIKQN